uniref:Uncharacterized protein n=1 Tax=Cacopsylla melanoneura TaxID=428564 RepID=A0A8D9FGL3_9HEMI
MMRTPHVHQFRLSPQESVLFIDELEQLQDEFFGVCRRCVRALDDGTLFGGRGERVVSEVAVFGGRAGCAVIEGVLFVLLGSSGGSERFGADQLLEFNTLSLQLLLFNLNVRQLSLHTLIRHRLNIPLLGNRHWRGMSLLSSPLPVRALMRRETCTRRD